ncbi:hypothetical protein VTO42DRAFT_7824 [Malbranchea cinnamomea]
MRIFLSHPLRRASLTCHALLFAGLLRAPFTQASISLNIGDDQSIMDAAKQAAAGMLQYYTGNQPGDVPGNLPDPYYWWEAGAMLNSLIDYYYFTGDDEYNDLVMQAMLHQVGPNNNYMPENQTHTLGNDDQAFWGMAALTAAENKFPNPPDDKPQWLALAQAVFNSQAHRWDLKTCAGGLRWQVFTFNKGYSYKNTITNGCFFNIAARLASYTGNSSYADWADKAWDWMQGVGLLSPSYQAFDGTDVSDNCSLINHVQWTYNNGILLSGAAHMYRFTKESNKWKERVHGLLKAGEMFFAKDPPNVMTEVSCDSIGECNVDQRSFKAYLCRDMATTAKLVPDTYDNIMAKLRASASAAALQCNGPNNACGLRWTEGDNYDGSTGVGEQMAALEVFQSLLVDRVEGPANNDTGISRGDPSAGGEEGPVVEPPDITTADRVGAGLVTVIFLTAIVSGAGFLIR